jgi:hypothetical protein
VIDDDLDTIRRRHDPRTLRVRAATDPAAFKQHAERVPGVQSIVFDEDPGVLEIAMNDEIVLDEGIPSELVEALNGIGPMRSLEIRTPTLDDVFVKLVGTTIASVEASETP